MGETVIDVLTGTAERMPEVPAFAVRQDGGWESTSWRAYRELVFSVARGLIALGLSPGAGVGILSFNRPEWFLAYLGAMAAGGLPTGIYETNPAEECAYIIAHAEVGVVVVEDEEQLDKILSVRHRLPKLEAIVLLEGDPTSPETLTWSELLDLGMQASEELAARLAALRDDSPATLIYTSGTTGAPKAVALSHSNLVWTAHRVREAYGIAPGETVLSYLPLSHIAEQIVSLHVPMAAAACTCFAESLDRLRENLCEVRPHLFFAVPRVWEKMQAAIEDAGRSAPRFKRSLAAWARRKGLAQARAAQSGGRRPVAAGLAKRLVFEPVRRRLGLDRARICATSTAPIAVETLEFFASLGIVILEVYGMSECTGPATFSFAERFRFGKAGFSIPGTEIALAEDGEILIRGPHVFLGYFKDEDATHGALDGEGWLHSGDVGDIDEDGFLAITDRKKDLIITAGGKNVAPQKLEGLLRGLPGISQAVVVGDRQRFIAALLTLDPGAVEHVASEAGSPAKTVEEAIHCSRFRAYIESRVGEVNRRLARSEQVRRFAFLSRELSIESGELTPSQKIRRKVVQERQREVIESLYA
ncbi:MAG TPA: AMP-binding protein [Thermoanaerobaculia bacterium]|nr:AMP-binding protein [Thermoanaerobaculia bacterium]